MKRAKTIVISDLAVLCTLTVAVAFNIGSRMRRELVSPKREPVETGSSRSDANTFGNTMVKGKATIRAVVGNPAFARSEPIIIKLTLRNDTDAEIYIIDSSPVRDNQLEIKNSTGEKTPLSEKAKKMLESPVLRTIVSRIGAGQVVQYAINVLDSYDLSANGAYTLTVKRKILLKDRNKFVELESNPIKVVVRPAQNSINCKGKGGPRVLAQGSIRHPPFEGLREDKNLKKVVREQPMASSRKTKPRSL